VANIQMKIAARERYATFNLLLLVLLFLFIYLLFYVLSFLSQVQEQLLPLTYEEKRREYMRGVGGKSEKKRITGKRKETGSLT